MQNVKKIPWEINGIFLRTRLLSITITDDIFPVYDRDKKKGFHLYPSELRMFKCLFWITNPACMVHVKYVLLPDFAEKEGLLLVYFTSNDN